MSGIDVFWPGILSEKLTDLKPYFSTEVASMNPDVVASYTINGRLVAIPYRVDVYFSKPFAIASVLCSFMLARL